MEVTMFILFASTYSNITNPLTDLVGDIALELNQTTKACKYDTTTLEEAVNQFCLSEIYKTFCEKVTGRVYVYRVFEDASVMRVN